jgi:hypothetical protein
MLKIISLVSQSPQWKPEVDEFGLNGTSRKFRGCVQFIWVNPLYQFHKLSIYFIYLKKYFPTLSNIFHSINR